MCMVVCVFFIYYCCVNLWSWFIVISSRWCLFESAMPLSHCREVECCDTYCGAVAVRHSQPESCFKSHFWCFCLLISLHGAADVDKTASVCNLIDIQPIRGMKVLWLVVRMPEQPIHVLVVSVFSISLQCKNLLLYLKICSYYQLDSNPANVIPVPSCQSLHL